MKTLQLSLLTFVLFFFAQTSFAQAKSEKFTVSGNCGMCKNKIEAAAKSAGATYAVWNEESKELAVKYKAGSSAEKIQKSIAAAGYDTPGFKATDEAYDKLHGCCKYDRAAASSNCCESNNCTKEECKNCCKDGKCTDATMACCKDGKCGKEIHSGGGAKESAGCCKKASH